MALRMKRNLGIVFLLPVLAMVWAAIMIPGRSPTDTLVLTRPSSAETVRYLVLKNRCVDESPIALLQLETEGFEDKVYSDSDSVRFRFAFAIRPETDPHEFQLVFYGQTDYSNG